MNSPRCQLLRLLTGIASLLLAVSESPLWWIAVIPWAVLCIFGIIATIPVFLIIGMGAGGAQADWMSDAFVFGLFLVTPTLLALAIAEFWKWWAKRRGIAACPDDILSGHDIPPKA